jgi:hypothetical protein
MRCSRIKEEGLQRSRVMEHRKLSHRHLRAATHQLAEIKEATTWTQTTMKEWGLANVHTESFPFGRGWQNQRMVAMALTPRAYPLHRLSESVDAGHQRPRERRRDRGGDQQRGGLREVPRQAAGKFVLTVPMGDVPAHFDAQGVGSRRTSSALSPDSLRVAAVAGAAARTESSRRFARKRTQFFLDEGVAALLDYSREQRSANGDGGTVFVQGAPNVSRDSEGSAAAAAGHACRRALRTDRAHARQEHSRHAAVRYRQPFFDDDTNALNIVGEIAGQRQGG